MLLVDHEDGFPNGKTGPKSNLDNLIFFSDAPLDEMIDDDTGFISAATDDGISGWLHNLPGVAIPPPSPKVDDDIADENVAAANAEKLTNLLIPEKKESAEMQFYSDLARERTSPNNDDDVSVLLPISSPHYSSRASAASPSVLVATGVVTFPSPTLRQRTQRKSAMSSLVFHKHIRSHSHSNVNMTRHYTFIDENDECCKDDNCAENMNGVPRSGPSDKKNDAAESSSPSFLIESTSAANNSTAFPSRKAMSTKKKKKRKKKEKASKQIEGRPTNPKFKGNKKDISTTTRRSKVNIIIEVGNSAPKESTKSTYSETSENSAANQTNHPKNNRLGSTAKSPGDDSATVSIGLDISRSDREYKTQGTEEEASYVMSSTASSTLSRIPKKSSLLSSKGKKLNVSFSSTTDVRYFFEEVDPDALLELGLGSSSSSFNGDDDDEHSFHSVDKHYDDDDDLSTFGPDHDPCGRVNQIMFDVHSLAKSFGFLLNDNSSVSEADGNTTLKVGQEEIIRSAASNAIAYAVNDKSNAADLNKLDGLTGKAKAYMQLMGQNDVHATS